MRQRKRFIACLFLLTSCFFLPLSARAGSMDGIVGYDRVYHTPALTFVVLEASPQISMEVSMFPRQGKPYTTLPRKETRLWENYFRITRQHVEGQSSWFGNRYDFKDAVVHISDEGKELDIPIPYESLKEGARENDFLMIDLAKGSVRVGKPLGREILFFLFHLLIYVLVESLVMLYYGLKHRRSWILFLIFTIVSKSAVCYFTRDWLNSDPKHYLVFAAIALLYILVDVTFYLLVIESEDKDKMSKSAGLGNLLAALAMYFALTKLPT